MCHFYHWKHKYIYMCLINIRQHSNCIKHLCKMLFIKLCCLKVIVFFSAIVSLVHIQTPKFWQLSSISLYFCAVKHLLKHFSLKIKFPRWIILTYLIVTLLNSPHQYIFIILSFILLHFYLSKLYIFEIFITICFLKLL